MGRGALDGVVLEGLFEEVRFQCIPGDSGLFLRKNAEEGESPGEMLAPSSYESLFFLPTLSIFCLITRLTF